MRQAIKKQSTGIRQLKLLATETALTGSKLELGIRWLKLNRARQPLRFNAKIKGDRD